MLHRAGPRQNRPAAGRSRITVSIRRGIPTLQPDLMRPVARLEWHEELRIELESRGRGGVALHHPAADAVGVELAVPGAVQRVSEVDTLTVTAHLDHLRPAIDRTGGRMGCAPDDPADAHGAGQTRRERV